MDECDGNGHGETSRKVEFVYITLPCCISGCVAVEAAARVDETIALALRMMIDRCAAPMELYGVTTTVREGERMTHVLVTVIAKEECRNELDQGR